MTARIQELVNKIEELPVEVYYQIDDYLDYLKYKNITSKIPQELIIKDEEDLREKLNEGIEDVKNGNTRPFDDVFNDIEKRLEE